MSSFGGNLIEVSLDPKSKKFFEGITKGSLFGLAFLDDLFAKFNELSFDLSQLVIKESLTGQKLKRRSGDLARSTTGRAIRIHGIPAIRVGVFRGPTIPYAVAHEEGRVIRPRRAKALAIPTDAAKTATGRAKVPGPRDFGRPLTFLPFRRGIAIGGLFDEQEVDTLQEEGIQSPYNARMFYVLLTEVTIPASRWLSTPVIDALPFIAEEIAQFIAERRLN